MSCRNPNVQNLPRDPALRACFLAPEGHRLLAADFSQIELRIAGLLSQDPVILSAYQDGRDLHREIAARITSKPSEEATPEERKLGKVLNFGLLYGAGPSTFRTRARVDYGLDLSLEDAQRFREVFDQAYTQLRQWQMENQREAKRRDHIKPPGGRVVSFRDPSDCYTGSRNYPIQSAAADLQLLAIQRVHQKQQETAVPGYLVNFVHDELVLEVREAAAEEISTLLRDQMVQAFLDLFKEHPEAGLIAHGLVEVRSGPNYAELKE
jgi:DNA polymerase-1